MTDVLTAAEDYTAALARELLAVRPHECPACYVVRQLDDFGCDGTARFADRWAAGRRLETTGPQRRLRAGAADCDCAVFIDRWAPRLDLMVWNPSLVSYDWPPTLPPCVRIGPRSCFPCSVWRPQRAD